MKTSDFVVILILVLIILGISKISKLREVNTRLKIRIIEDELFSAEQIFDKMLVESKDQEINWDWSGIGNQKTVIDRMKIELEELNAKSRRFGIFFF